MNDGLEGGKRSEVWEETHLMPLRFRFQVERDGSVVMQLPGYQFVETTMIGESKPHAIAKMREAMATSTGKPSNA